MRNNVIKVVSELEELVNKLEAQSSSPSASDLKRLEDLEGDLFIATIEHPILPDDPLHFRCRIVSGTALAIRREADDDA